MGELDLRPTYATKPYRSTDVLIDVFIFLADGLTGVTTDLSDLLRIKIVQINREFYFEKINTPEWRNFLKEIKKAISDIASNDRNKKKHWQP